MADTVTQVEDRAKEQMVLYTKFAENDIVKKMAADAGLDIAYDRQKGAFMLDVAGADPAKRAQFEAYTTDAAKAGALAERDQYNVQKSLKAAAKEHEVPVEKAMEGAGKVVTAFVAFSQREEYKNLVKETGSTSRYIAATDDVGAHWKLRTEQPEKFAAFIGPEAEGRFKQEYASRDAGKSMNQDAEAARSDAKEMATRFFNANIKSGYRLPDPQSQDAKLAEFGSLKIREMSAASDRQIEAVLKSTNIEIAKLINKERDIRAEAAGMTSAQMKEFDFAKQRELATGPDGKVAGLDREDSNRLSALRRGQAALTNELTARGVAVPSREKQTEAAIAAEKVSTPAIGAEVVKTAQVERKGPSIEDTEMYAALQRKNAGMGR